MLQRVGARIGPPPCTFACPAISDASVICASSVADPTMTKQFEATCVMLAYNCNNPDAQ